jgi:hypothetical protein
VAALSPLRGSESGAVFCECYRSIAAPRLWAVSVLWVITTLASLCGYDRCCYRSLITVLSPLRGFGGLRYCRLLPLCRRSAAFRNCLL